MSVKTYDPREVKGNDCWSNCDRLCRWNEVVIERSEPNQYNEHVGAQGEVSRTATTNKTALLKNHFKTDKPFNQTMQTIAATLNAAKFPGPSISTSRT